MIEKLISGLWINRRKKADPSALAAVEGKTPVVVVTGGSRGIGLAIATRFAAAGRNVALVARNEAGLADGATRIKENTGQEPLLIPLDITDTAALEKITQQVSDSGGYIDILVNNAGAGTGGKFVKAPEAEIANIIDVNVMALTQLTRQVLPEMLARGRGGIINVSSLGGLLPGPYQATYYASKAYVISLTRALAHEVSGHGVRISCVAPGPVKTGFHASLDRQNRALYRYLLPWFSVKTVADSTYRGYLLGHAMIIPGFVYSIVYLIVGLLPYALAVPMVGMLLYPGDQESGSVRSEH